MNESYHVCVMTKIDFVILIISLPVDVFGVQLQKERKVAAERNICLGQMAQHVKEMKIMTLLTGVLKVNVYSKNTTRLTKQLMVNGVNGKGIMTNFVKTFRIKFCIIF